MIEILLSFGLRIYRDGRMETRLVHILNLEIFGISVVILILLPLH